MIWFVLALMSQNTIAHETSCFSRHIEDAIEINKARRELYSELTGGKSESISELTTYKTLMSWIG